MHIVVVRVVVVVVVVGMHIHEHASFQCCSLVVPDRTAAIQPHD
jgi:hypothetical protein